MHPGFRVTVLSGDGAQDITANVNMRLLSIDVCDQPGLYSDRFTIHLDDRQPYINLPLTGERLQIELGYLQAQNNEFPAPMKALGTFILDELEVEKQSGGRSVAITGHGWDTESPFKQPRTLSYHEKKLGDIVNDIAQRNNWTATVTKDLGEKHLKHTEQKNISDAAFLDDLASQYNAQYKVYNDILYFSDPDELADLIDQTNGSLVLYDWEVIRFHYLTQGRGRYTAVRAKYHDRDDKGQLLYVTTELDDTAARKEVYYELPETFPSKEEALDAANAQKERFSKSQALFSFSCIGTPELASDGLVNIAGFRPDIPTEWRLQKVTHRLTTAGYICECEAGINLPHKRKKGNQPVGGTNKVQVRPIR